jgi:DNA polymerase-3 subunit delta
MVAIRTQQAQGFIKAPDPKCVAVLVFGTDAGLVSERASAIAKAVAKRESGEVIRIEESDLDTDPDRLAVELQTMPMFGGRNVVRTTAGRKVNAAMLKPLIEGGTLAGTLIVEAGNLRADESLRALFEKSATAAAIACYPDEARDLDGVVREVLSAAKLDISAEAKELLISRLGADRALSRNEVEKLALYARGKSRIEADDVDAIVGDAAELAVDRVVTAAFGGRLGEALEELDRAQASGESVQTVVLAMERYLHRLHRVRSSMDLGRGLDDALRGLRPPLHFKARPAFEAHLRMWRTQSLTTAQRLVATAVRETRLSAHLETPLAERLIMNLARLSGGKDAGRRR